LSSILATYVRCILILATVSLNQVLAGVPVSVGEGAQRLLIVDLGEMTFRNEDEGITSAGEKGVASGDPGERGEGEGEDRWTLCLARMQVHPRCL
jgi:hypothetical protein